MSAPDKTKLLARLRPFGQEHLLRFWDELTDAQRAALAGQIDGIDFTQIATLCRQATSDAPQDAQAVAERASEAEPPPAIRLADQRAGASAADARRRGEEALRAGKLGVVLVAGGQGTRLGFDHPKGLYEIGPVSGASLFQILFEKLLARGRRYGVRIPLYLMTSPATHDETLAALDEPKRYGLPAKDVLVFCQGTMPAVDAASGRLLLEDKGKLFASPDGHGGMLAALDRSGGLADIRRRGLEQLFYMQVDNPLVEVCDPAFIGYHLAAGSEASTQVVQKLDPLDRVGNVVSIDGRVQIIEYSDLPENVARLPAPDGSLKLWAGNIAVHVFDVAFLARMSEHGGRLPFHIARKIVPYIDDAGHAVEPEKPNAIKFERFIFDLLPAARTALVVEVDEAAAFAPLKNGPGAKRDTPEWVRGQMVALHRGWLEKVGATVANGVQVEISPLFALDAAEVATKIPRGLRVTADRYFR
ncbi:MAG: UDPGP type 1 family protein [Planctomycetia bacterium]|nr:UDPGP type 1 family protein [Planctomycetia bacterium]